MLPLLVATAQDKFKDLLSKEVAPWLKERGFKRRDATFRRRRPGTWQIVNFQRSKFSDASVVLFTANLGVALDVLHADPPWGSRGWPLEYECDFRQRIGALHKGEDHWWKVRQMRPTGRTSRDVLQALEKGLSWLDAHTDPHRLLNDTMRDPLRVTAFNLGTLVALAKQIGSERQIAVAEEELRRWQQGERLGR